MKLDLGEPKKRLLLAAAISIAIHEAAAGLVPQGLSQPPPSAEVITRARIVQIAVRSNPTPRPVRIAERSGAVSAPPAPRRAAAGQHPTAHAASAQRAQVPRRVARLASSSRPVWDVAGSASAGAMVASGGRASNGAGASTGDDAQGGDTRPCGFVTFSDPHGSQYDSRTHGFWVDIRMAVRFSDGSTQSMILDYSWYYPNEGANPWSDQNLRDPNFPTRFQQPPPEKAAGEPPLVQYVMTHSTADGLTLLRDCPAPDPAPSD